MLLAFDTNKVLFTFEGFLPLNLFTLNNKATALETQLRYKEKYLNHYGAERVRKHGTVIKSVAKILNIFLSFRPWQWANIGIPFSKTAIMSIRKSLECKTKAWRMNSQQNRALAPVKMLYGSLSLNPNIGSL